MKVKLNIKFLSFQKVWVALALLFVSLFSLPKLMALTPSFTVNTFAPTIDDSDFFTVYSSPTMLKRNYHVGLYLDYAHNPYEFGNADFDRQSGIVDHLLTANVVGSYAITDWMTAGAVIPVHILEGIRSPLLGIDENNFALGDIKLVLKFRLLDRDKHGVGVALVPFLSFPSSTNSTDFLGDGRFSGGAKVVIDGRINDRVSIALNVGYNSRNRIFDIGNNELDDQLLIDLGISVDAIRKYKNCQESGNVKECERSGLKVIGEVQSASVLRELYSNRRTTPVEGRAGFRYTFKNNHDINAGAGFGLTNGIGSPAVRGFVGYTYTKRPLTQFTLPDEPTQQKLREYNLGDELTAQDKIFFEFDLANIREISKPTLDKIAGVLKAHPYIQKIRIEGHTCDLGSDSYNQRLSSNRAQSVREYLIGQGIDASRIGTVMGYGESSPLVPNQDEMSREQNRRVQIFVEEVSESEEVMPAETAEPVE